MSNEAHRRSPAEWFLESFFQERNIKWMLALGVMIVFGSSLMLVTRQWETWSTLWKSLAVIGYSGAVFACGELAFCRLGLRNTGTVMRSLTLLLLPLSFLAVNRLGVLSLPMQMGLLVLDAALTGFAARRIFAEFLRGSQPTLVATYLTLAVAGGVLRPLTGIAAPLVALVLWGVFSIGTVKSARRVFWLAEEHKRPRVFGFVPVLLLGAQFLTLFVLNCASEMTLPWLGLGCVLMAVPVLLTTDAIAKVFQQRTGDLVRPLPWSIVLPLFVGLVLCVSGVGLAAIPQVGRSLFSLALTPAAGLAALMMLVAARRTNHSAFVWAGLIGAAISYQAAPAYFIETARLIVQSAATSVHEQRLPVAFYGLTWLPLIVGSMLAAVRAARRGDTLIEVPCRRFAMFVAVLLFAISFTHAKAIFPVAAAMTVTFGLQAVLFANRRLQLAAALAWTALTCSSQFFATEVFDWPMNEEAHRLVMLGGAALLLFRVGGWALLPVRRLIGASSNRTNEAGQGSSISLLHTVAIAAMWLVAARPETVMSLATLGGFAAAGLLLIHAWKWLTPGLSELSLASLLAVIVKSSLFWISDERWLFLVWTVPALAMWFVGQGLLNRNTRLSVSFGRPSVRISTLAMTLLLLISQAGLLVWNVLRLGGAANSWDMLLPAIVATIWAFDVARRGRNADSHRAWRVSFAAVGCIAVLTTTASVLIGAEHLALIPTAWAAMAFVATIVLAVRHRDNGKTGWHALRLCEGRDNWPRPSMTQGVPSTMTLGPIAMPVRVISMSVLVLTAIVTLFVEPFGTLARLAGLIATSGLLLDSVLRRDREQRETSLILGQWQIAMLVATVMAPSLRTLSDLLSSAALPAALPVAVTVAMGLTALRRWRCSHVELNSTGPHAVLSVATIAAALSAAAIAPMSVIGIGSVALAVVTFAILAVGEFAIAVRRQRVDGVWMAQGIFGTAVTWLLVAGVISFGNGVSMFACTIAALVCLSVSKLCLKAPRLVFAADAFSGPAHVLPLLSVAIGVVRHVDGAPAWLGMNSLAVLMSAAFYFWQAIETDEAAQPKVRRDRFLLSAVIVNVAFGLLWHELQFSDPQFFMIPAGLTILWLVELLKREIPESERDPLRYVGALTILVSPTFHIISGSWLHLISLMICSVLIALLAIGLRLRALVYSGTAFLIADLLAMVIRGSIDHPNLLWLAGLAVGASVITLGAICENHRERLLTRLRVMAAELQGWK